MIDPMAIVGMAFTLIMVLLVGGFIAVFPLVRRLGDVLEETVRERRLQRPAEEAAEAVRGELGDRIAILESKLDRLVDRQQFMEALLAGNQGAAGGRAALEAGSSGGGSAGGEGPHGASDLRGR